MLKSYKFLIPSIILTCASIISFLVLTNSNASADESVVSNVSLSAPVSCNVTSNLDTPHTATINPGTFAEDIGITTFKVFCNDNTGYALYAIGYSNEEYGNTNLLPTNTSNPAITTGLATSGNTSAWAMKLTPVTTESSGTEQPYVPTIENGYENYSLVPEEYTKVATFTATTDFTIGSSLTSTYRAYIQNLQPADTYNGKVKYTLVHPNDANPPEDPRFVAQLDTGPTINVKMKNLANNTTDATTTTEDTKITAIVRATELPAGFTPATENTISLSTSAQPVYIFFDDSTGTMNYYTEANHIYLNSIASYMFRDLIQLEDISGLTFINTSQTIAIDRLFFGCINLINLSPLANWDTSKVETIRGIFNAAVGHNMIYADLTPLSNWNTSNIKDMGLAFKFAVNLTNINALSSWDTSNVTDMQQLFCGNRSLADINGLKNWNTSKVTNMNNLFGCANGNSITDIDALSNWDTSSVTNMANMFRYSSSLTNIDGANNWDTSSVTEMNSMFYGASSLTNIDGASNWGTSSVTNMANMFRDSSSLTNIDGANNWDTSSVTNMSSMFYGASSLTNISGAANWNTGNITNIGGIFYNVNNIDATVLNNWDVSKVTNKSNAFTCPADKRPSWY